MLFWEAVSGRRRRHAENLYEHTYPHAATRLPYDKRCAAKTKSGRRCRGRIREGTEFCAFHDPEVSPQQRRYNAKKGGRTRRRLSHIPDGYLRKLTDRASVGHAMDRLYREVRLGVVTPEMGRVLFDILCRLLDAMQGDGGLFGEKRTRAGRADRIRPKLSEVLTEPEQQAWRQAVANAPAEFFRMTADERAQDTIERERQGRTSGEPSALPAAS